MTGPNNEDLHSANSILQLTDPPPPPPFLFLPPFFLILILSGATVLAAALLPPLDRFGRDVDEGGGVASTSAPSSDAASMLESLPKSPSNSAILSDIEETSALIFER